MTEQSEPGQVPFNKGIEHWLAYAFCCSVVIALGILVSIGANVNNRLNQLDVRMERVYTQLEVTSPADVMHEVLLLKSASYTTAEEVRRLMKDNAPWIHERDKWEEWKRSVERRLTAMETGNK